MVDRREPVSSRRALAMSKGDNVAVVLEGVEAGDEVHVQIKGSGRASVRALERIPFGFKVALIDLGKGAGIIRYGETIGRAVSDIKRGKQVHVHNVEGLRAQREDEKGEV
jgi:altronate dehydratase small subunit